MMKVRKDKPISKILALVLAIALVVGVLPTTSYALASYCGTVEAISSGITVTGSTSVEATNSDVTTLKWVAADTSLGRDDGWWAGIKVTAPSELSSDELELVKIQKKDGTEGEWSETILFKDVKDDETSVGLWTPVGKEAVATGENIVRQWQFDWDNDDTYEQQITLTLNPENIVLLDELGVQEFPKLGSVEAISGGTVTGSKTSNVSVVADKLDLTWAKADDSLGRDEDGWWAGIKVTAPSELSSDELELVKIQKRGGTEGEWSEAVLFKDVRDTEESVGLWCLLTPAILEEAESNNSNIVKQWQIDWNNDSTFEQLITLTIVPSDDIVLVKENQEALEFDNLSSTLTYSATPIKINVSGGSGTGDYTFAITEGTDIASVTEEGSLTLYKAGQFTLQASKLGDDTYNEANAITKQIEVVLAEQTIAFENGTNVEVHYGKQTYTNIAKPVGEKYGTGAISYEIVGENPLEASVDSTGVISLKDEKVGTITVKATKVADDCYKECSATYTLKVSCLETPAQPYILSGDTINESGWYTGDVKIKAPSGYEISYSNALTGNAWGNEVEVSEEGTNNKTVYLRNSDGAITDAIAVNDIKIDKTLPRDLSISYVTPTWKKVLEKISFGIYSAPVTVTLTATDDISSIAEFEYTYKNAQDTFSVEAENLDFDEKTASYKFTLEPEFRDTVTFKVTDVAGNSRDIVDQDDEGNEKQIVIDTEAPKLEVTYAYKDGKFEKDSNGVIYTQDDATVKFTITEANFDIADKPVVQVNGEDVVLTWTKDEQTGKWGGEYPLTAEGDYIVTVSFTDVTEKSVTPYEQEIRIDRTAPVISVTPVVNEKTYYNGPKTFEIKIVEHNFDLDKVIPSVVTTNELSGVSVKDYEALIKANWNSNGDVHTTTVTFAEDAQYQFTLDCTDLSGRTATQHVSGEFVVDNKAPVVGVTYDNNVASNDKYYKQSRTATITVEEHNFDAKDIVPVFNITRALDANEIEDYVAKLQDNSKWTTDGDIHTITIEFKEDADYQWTLDYTDLSGRKAVQYASEAFVIDNVDPVINVTYDNNDVANRKYYKAAREATITITEHNFRVEDVVAVVTATRELESNGKLDDYAALLRNPKNWNSDGDVHTAKVTFKEDADYVFTIDYTDLATRVAKQYATEFVVDNVDPKVEVKYDNKNVINAIDGRDYLNAQQQATITVTEHNFDAKDVNVIVEAVDVTGKDVLVDGGKDTLTKYYNDLLKNPASWTHNGDVHTATIKYAQDANYTFDIKFEDLAARSIADYAQNLFTVDTVAPSNLQATYSTSVFETAIETTRYGYYNGQMKVTISGEDATSGIHKFLYSYINSIGVSSVNAELIDAIIEKAQITQDGYKFTATFTIPKEALSADKQFNGTIEFTAYDVSGNNTEKVENKRIVVDNIKPTVQVTLNEPVKVVNTQSFYDGDIQGTIVIQEANFFAQDVEVIVTRDGASQVVNVKWVDDSVDKHTGTFTLTENGDYFITFRYADRSTNQMDEYVSNELTIDKEHPVISVSKVRMNTANKDEVYDFVISVKDTNFDVDTFKPVLTAVVRGEDGKYSEKEIPLGDMQTITAGEEYSYIIKNLEEDGLYSLVCTVKDYANNEYSLIGLDDGREYETVEFSINRDGSIFAITDENTEKVVEKYYVYSVEKDIVLEEISVDPVEMYVVKLNGKELEEGKDYSTKLSGGDNEWSKRTYSIHKELFAAEGEYSIVVESIDKAGTTAYSDVKDLKVAFVVDQTKPVLTISGLESNGRYQKDEQEVTVIPTDDGGRLNSFKVIILDSKGNPLLDENGNDISVRFDMSGEELLEYLEKNDGKITFTVPEGLENKVQIICNDCAMNTEGVTNEYNETFEKVTVSQSKLIIFYANKPLFYGTIAGVLVVISGIIYLIVAKKRKDEEE